MKSCKECGDKVYSKGLCRSHYEKDLRQRNPDFYVRQKQNNAAWRQKNTDKVQRAARNRKYDPVKKRDIELRWKYGITSEEYEQKLQEQGGVCFLCGGTNGTRPLFVDHCHTTGIVRKLLCHRCNLIIGFIETQKDKLEDYLNYASGNFDAIDRTKR